jgi:hypothetical protein
MIKIILLDVDGVLVQPGGYRAALRATVNHFIEPKLDIPEEWLTDLEKRGISSEWDMVPLLLAAYWAELLSRQPMHNLPSNVFSAANEINRQRKVEVPADLFIPDYPFVAGQYPAETALDAGCFASIPYDLRRNLLSETRNFHKSSTLRIFQHYTLGSKQFTETYNLPAEFESGSFLLMHDTSNINDEIRAKLCQSNCHLAAFTSRPSRPPGEFGDATLGYAPEAELALELVGLSNIPLIAFGKLEYLASQYGLDPATMVKPSAVQALAAVLAAWTGEEWLALQAANHWRETGLLSGMFDRLPKTFELIVVEDTMGGIYSARSASEILKKAGFDLHVHAMGLTSGNSAKAAAFERAGVSCFQDWGSLIKGVGL